MKRGMIVVSLLMTLCLAADYAMAAGTNASDSIAGRLGVTGRLGFLVPANNDFGGTDTGFVGGGGLIYGFTNNIAGDLEITHTGFGSDFGVNFDTTDFSIGVQYRCLELPIRHLVPYAGFGLDILVNGADSGLDVDTVAGVHLKGGVDYFLTRELALTSEIKGVVAPDADIRDRGIKVGNFDPNSFSMTFGVRYFFR